MIFNIRTITRSGFVLSLLILGLIQTIHSARQAEPIQSSPEATNLKTTHPPRFQEEKIDRDDWKRATEGLDYETEEEPEPTIDDSAFKGPNLSLSSETAKILLIVFFAILIIALLIYITRSQWMQNPGVRKDELTIRLRDAEADVEKADLESLFDAFLSKKRYREALRVKYLKILQQLSATGVIKWKKEKTNWDYMTEITDAPLQRQFREATAVFELTWYGKETISRETFEEVLPFYEEILSVITPKEVA